MAPRRSCRGNYGHTEPGREGGGPPCRAARRRREHREQRSGLIAATEDGRTPGQPGEEHPTSNSGESQRRTINTLAVEGNQTVTPTVAERPAGRAHTCCDGWRNCGSAEPAVGWRERLDTCGAGAASWRDFEDPRITPDRRITGGATHCRAPPVCTHSQAGAAGFGRPWQRHQQRVPRLSPAEQRTQARCRPDLGSSNPTRRSRP